MGNWLTAYRDQFEGVVFDFLWRQWNLLGVSGTTSFREERIIDPEALLLFSLSACRHDPRLFDEIIERLKHAGEDVVGNPGRLHAEYVQASRARDVFGKLFGEQLKLHSAFNDVDLHPGTLFKFGATEDERILRLQPTLPTEVDSLAGIFLLGNFLGH